MYQIWMREYVNPNNRNESTNRHVTDHFINEYSSHGYADAQRKKLMRILSQSSWLKYRNATVWMEYTGTDPI